MNTEILNLENKSVGEVALDASVFGVEVRRDILARVVNWQLAKRRQGTHSTRTVSEISGTTRKPYRQKGTGNARHGSLRNVQFRKGGVAHGPHPRSHEHSLQKKVRALGLRCALSQKFADKKLIIIDSLDTNSPKTKDLQKTLNNLGWESALFIGANTSNDNFFRALQNIPKMDMLPVMGANVYDILRRDTLVLTKESVALLEERLKK
jgi:large subunit ribosomal protein L4